MKRGLMAVVCGATMAVLAPLWAQSTSPAGTATPTVTAKDIKKYVGREVVACGRVVTYECDDKSGALGLDLDTPYTTSGISVDLAAAHWESSLGHGLTNQYVYAQVCARGTVKKAGSRYRVVVNDRAAIETITPPPPTAILMDPTAAQSCAAGIKSPQILREVKPRYTEAAMRGKQEGLVFLEAVVRPDGSVGNIRVLTPLLPELGLNANAVAAVQQWRFKPATLGGRPVPVLATFEMKFTLK